MKNSFEKQTAVMRPFEDGCRVAFYGDSITRNGEGITRTAAYYRTMFPEQKIRFFNAGISGGTVPAAHIFFGDLLEPVRPTHVVLAFGVNDAGSAIITSGTNDIEAEKRRSDEAVARFESEYERLIDCIREIGAAVVLRTPTPNDDRASGPDIPQFGRGAAHRRIADCVRNIAQKRSLPLVDDYASLSARLECGDDLFNNDRLHPNERGQWLLSEDFLHAQGLTTGIFRPFSDVVSEAGLADWHESAVNLTFIPSTEWLLMQGEALSLDEKLARVKKWLDGNEGKEGVNPAIVRFARGYLRSKPREAELRAWEESLAINSFAFKPQEHKQ